MTREETPVTTVLTFPIWIKRMLMEMDWVTRAIQTWTMMEFSTKEITVPRFPTLTKKILTEMASVMLVTIVLKTQTEIR
jgi:hypothetical protein